MKIWISYFNNIRNFNEHLIPVSTAMYDPKWYHDDSYDKSKTFVDKRGVVNGLRCNRLTLPIYKWDALVETGHQCSRMCQFNPNECKFMKLYSQYLKTVDFEKVMSQLKTYRREVAEFFYKIEHPNFPFLLKDEELDDYEIVLIVHEKPDCKCAERPVLIEWFKQYDVDVQEWVKGR